MTLTFRDVDGTEGIVTDELEVEYSGAWKREITEFVERLVGEESVEDRWFEGYNEMTHLLIELPEAAPVVEIERDDIASR